MDTGDLLICRAGNRLCALPVTHVAETMRPLPVDPMPETPEYVLGASMLRGSPTPVVDLGVLVSGARLNDARRLIALKVGSRQVGMLVSDVIGLRPNADFAGDAMPPLLDHCTTEVVAQLGRLDHGLLTVLKLGAIIPDELWQRLAEARA